MLANMNGISLDEAAIVSTVLEGTLYGFSLFMFGATIWALLYQRTAREVNWPMVVIATLLLTFSTVHLVLDIKRSEDGLVKYRDTYSGGPAVWFGDVTQKTFIAKNAIYTLQTLVGDGVVVYRCYVVWQSVWIVVLPILGMCGVAIGGIGAAVSSARATTYATDIFYVDTGRWVTMAYSATLGTTFLTTGLLAFRIWKISKNTADIRVNQNPLLPVLIIVIDAGGLYFLTLLAALICFTRQSNGQYIMIDLACPIISIAFYMIIIRIGVHKSSLGECSVGLTTMRSQAVLTSGLPRQSIYGPGAKSLEVHITQLTECDRVESVAMNSISKSSRQGSQLVV